MGAFYVAPQMGIDIAEAYLNAELGTGYEWWENFYEFHKLAIDELDHFDYDAYVKNGYRLADMPVIPLKLETKPE
jgi:ribose 5-phosphate isomerase B